MQNLLINTVADFDQNASIIEIDATDCNTLRNLYETLAKTLHFPDYFGFNLDSLDEMLNDLSWIEDENLVLFFNNSDAFLKDERNENKIITLLDLFDATAEDWKWFEEDKDIENEDEENEKIPKKSLQFGFSDSERIKDLFAKL